MTQGLGILVFFGGAGVFSRNSRFFIRNSRIPKLALCFGLCGSSSKNKAPRFLSYFLCSQRSTSRGAVSAVAAGEISRLNFKDEVRRKLP